MGPETILSRTVGQLPKDIVAAAHHAAQSKDFETSLAHWTRLRATAPRDARGWIGSFNTLVQLGRQDEAKALLLSDAAQDACGPTFFALRARLSQLEDDWLTAASFWRLAVREDGANTSFRSGLVSALLRVGQFEDAEEILKATPDTISGHPDMLSASAYLMERTGKWSEARHAWQRFIEAAPLSPAGPAGLGRTLNSAKRHAAANALLAEARSRFPDDPGVAVAFASVASSCFSWEEARSRWQEVLRIAPDSAFAQAQMQHAVDQIEKHDPALVSILDCFVSLGCNCEFGILQKEFGSTQSDLLKWSYTQPKSLIQALQSNFTGVGGVDQTDISVRKDEYILTDTKYELKLHTFLYTIDGAQADIYRKQCRRVRMLADKMTGLLSRGETIFVYKHAELTPDLVTQIHDALQLQGPNFLLCVRPKAAGSKISDLVMPRPTLAFAEIEHEGGQPDGSWNIDKATWISLCRRTYAIWRENDRARSV